MSTKEANQRSFDLAAVALIKQGRPSGDESFCLYRGPDGTRCAAGHLFEGEAGVDFAEQTLANEGKVADLLAANGHDPEFVTELQDAHDAAVWDNDSDSWLANWRANMVEVAEAFGLSTAVLDQIDGTQCST